MSLLKKLFGGAERAPASSASGLQTCVRDAERHVAAGRLDDALKVAQRGLQTFPSAERLRNVVQFVQREKALGRLSKLKEKVETDHTPESYCELVELYLELSKTDSALETAQAFVDEHPERADAHAGLGHVQLKRYISENFARDGWSTIESLEKAVELAPDSREAHFRLAVLYFAIGAMGACTSSIDLMLDLEPDDALTEFRNEVAARFDEDEDVE
ncbi:MAG: tetratricopeptide repeat protein, partial [Planctomycetota bacterium]